MPKYRVFIQNEVVIEADNEAHAREIITNHPEDWTPDVEKVDDEAEVFKCFECGSSSMTKAEYDEHYEHLCTKCW